MKKQIEKNWENEFKISFLIGPITYILFIVVNIINNQINIKEINDIIIYDTKYILLSVVLGPIILAITIIIKEKIEKIILENKQKKDFIITFKEKNNKKENNNTIVIILIIIALIMLIIMPVITLLLVIIGILTIITKILINK